MKKIFSICAAIVAAMTLNAQTAMTCAEAATAALALGEGETATEDVIVTGYVTNTNGNISRGQQTFYMDDEKGTAQTLQSYWGNLPQDCIDNNEPLNVGDKVSLTGKLMHYVNSAGTSHVAEIKNGTVVILERAVVRVDTIQATPCEAVEEGNSLNAGEYSEEVFDVTGKVASVTNQNTTYNQATFYFACEDNLTALQGYNCTFDGDLPAIGDTVRVKGKIMNYNNSQIEFNGGQATVIGKAVVNTITCNVSFATATGMALDRGALGQSLYVITGYVDSIATAYSEQHDNISFFMCEDMANPTYDFEAYRVKGGADLKVGDKVVVTGYIQHYYKAATETEPEVELIETVAGATYELLSGAAVENVKTATKAVKVIENGMLIIIKDGVRYSALGVKL